MNPKCLAANRRMKKCGRAAAIPLREVNPPPATEWKARRCVRLWPCKGPSHKCSCFWSYVLPICVFLVILGLSKRRLTLEIEHEVAESSISLNLWRLDHPCFPPKSPTQSPKVRTGALRIHQNFDHFSISMFGRFGVVLGPHLEFILATVGGQVGPSSIKNVA